MGRVGNEPSHAPVKGHTDKEGQKRNQRNAKKLLQQKKRGELLVKRRGLGSRDGPPHIVAIIVLSSAVPHGAARSFLLSSLSPQHAALTANPVTVAYGPPFLCGRHVADRAPAGSRSTRRGSRCWSRSGS